MSRPYSLAPRHLRVAGPPLKHPDVTPTDLPALRDLVRFGVMADDQLARRYPDPALAFKRLPQLQEAGVVDVWWEPLEGARVYSPTRLTWLITRVPDVNPRTPKVSHMAHDVAVVDLADYLVAHEPDVRFVAEDEVRAVLRHIGLAPHRFRHDSRHQPDGLLVTSEHRIAIELEHTDKYSARYSEISGWFVRDWRVDRVRWYIDNPRIIHRLRDVNASHGYDQEMDIQLMEFPPGVRLRQRRGKFQR